MNSKEIKIALKKAREKIDSQNYSETLVLCQSILTSDPKNYFALVFMGYAFNGDGSYEEARGVYEKAISQDQNKPLAWEGLASCYEKWNQNKNSTNLENVYRNLIRIYTDDTEKCSKFMGKLASLYTEENDFERAAAEYDKLICIHVNSPDLISSLTREPRVLCLLSQPSKLFVLRQFQRIIVNSEDMKEKESVLDCFLEFARETVTFTEFRSYCLLYSQYVNHSRLIEILLLMEIEERLGTKFVYSELITELNNKLRDIKPDSSMLLVSQAYEMIVRGRFKEALQLLQQNDTDESSVPVCYYVFLAYSANRCSLHVLAEKSSSEGILCLSHDNAKTFNSWLIECHLHLELAFSLHGQSTEGSLLQAAELLNEDVLRGISPDAIILLVDIHLKLKDIPSTESLLEHEDIDDSSRFALYGWISFLQGDLNNAANLLQESIASYDSIHHRLHVPYMLGYVYWQMLQDGDSSVEAACHDALKQSVSEDPFYCNGHYVLAMFHQEHLKDKKKALQYYQEVFKLNPGYEDTLRRLCDLHLDLNQLNEVRSLLSDFVKDNVTIGNEWVWLRLGLVLLKQKDFSAAISCLQSALRIDTKNSNIWESLAEAYLKHGSYTAALKSFTKALQLSPNSLFSRYQIAMTSKALHLYPQAINDFMEILNSEPYYIPALQGISEVHLEVARENMSEMNDGRATLNCQAAVNYLSRGIMKKFDMIGLWKILGDTCSAMYPISSCRLHISKFLQTECKEDKDNMVEIEKKDILELASKCYTKAVSLSGGDVHLLYDLALSYYLRSQVVLGPTQVTVAQFSLDLLKQIVTRYPGNHMYWTALGSVAANKIINDRRLAQHCFIKSIKLEKNNVLAWTHLGVLYLEADKVFLAHEAFTIAQAIDPDFIPCWIGEAFIAQCIGHEEAMDLARHTTELGNHVEGLLKYGDWVCRIVGNESKMASDSYQYSIIQMSALTAAETALHKYLKRVKTNPAAYNLYGMILERNGLLKSAARAYGRSLEIYKQTDNLKTERDDCTFNLIRVLGSLKEVERMQTVFKSFHCSTNYRNLVSLGLMFYKSGDYASSYQAYEEALSLCPDSLRADIHAALGLVSYAYGELDAAKSEFISSAQEKELVGLPYLASLSMIQSDLDLCLECVKAILDLSNNNTALIQAFPTVLAVAAETNHLELAALCINRLRDDPDTWQLLSCLFDVYPESTARIIQTTSVDEKVHNSLVLGCVKNLSPVDLLRLAQKNVHLYPSQGENWVTLAVCVQNILPAVSSIDHRQTLSKLKDFIQLSVSAKLPPQLKTYCDATLYT